MLRGTQWIWYNSRHLQEAKRLLFPSQEQGENKMQKHVCKVCGYVYDPAENNGVAFADLPADWVCPLCGVGKDMFEPLP